MATKTTPLRRPLKSAWIPPLRMSPTSWKAVRPRLRNGLDPEAYLRFVLRELPRIHHAPLGELTPLAWAASRSLA